MLLPPKQTKNRVYTPIINNQQPPLISQDMGVCHAYPSITQKLFRPQGSSAFGLTLATKSERSGASRKRRRGNPRSCRPEFLGRYVLRQLKQCVYVYILHILHICIYIYVYIYSYIYMYICIYNYIYMRMDIHKLAGLPIITMNMKHTIYNYKI
jgi:hypothetical protein